MSNRLSFYTVDSAYCDYLRQFDRCVPYTMDKKSTRPFVGIVLQIGDIAYYAPLSSPKPKHTKMKNNVDFMKIQGGQFGVINLNNMIPIHMNSLTEIDLTVSATDTQADKDYKNLLVNQREWCNRNRADIFKKAEALHRLITSGKAQESLLNRCCAFVIDEEKYHEYVSAKGWNFPSSKQDEQEEK